MISNTVIPSQGTSIKIYGTSFGVSSLDIAIDGVWSYIRLNDTNPVDGPKLISESVLKDGDHELLGAVPYRAVNMTVPNATLVLDYFECVVTLTLLYPNNIVLPISLFPVLKIRLEWASIFSIPGQPCRTSKDIRSLWTMMTRRLHSITPLSGRL
jgi:hypothetical protein